MANERKETDLQKVKKLIEVMKAEDLVELEIVNGDSKIHLKRPSPQQPIVSTVPMVTPGPSPPAQEAEEKKEQDGLVDITSPIIGTFYAAPSPDSEPYVQTGSEVNPETVVCIVEAMKVMNEIKAEVSGTIAKVMVANGQAVEYGQVLFKVKPY